MTRNEFAAALGKQIRDKLDYNGITQTDFAKRIGVAASTVSGYVHGERMPDALTLRRIAEELDTSTGDLLGVHRTVDADAPHRPTNARVCPRCWSAQGKVIDIRTTSRGLIRRRRCTQCYETWTTIEIHFGRI